MFNIQKLIVLILLFLILLFGFDYIQNKKNNEFSIKSFLIKNMNNIIAFTFTILAFDYFMPNINVSKIDEVYLDNPFN